MMKTPRLGTILVEQGRITAEILEGHQSTALCHLGNISWRLGRRASLAELRAELGEEGVEDVRVFGINEQVNRLLDNCLLTKIQHNHVIGRLARAEAGDLALLGDLARGAAFGDLNNDGAVDVAVNVSDGPAAAQTR